MVVGKGWERGSEPEIGFGCLVLEAVMNWSVLMDSPMGGKPIRGWAIRDYVDPGLSRFRSRLVDLACKRALDCYIGRFTAVKAGVLA